MKRGKKNDILSSKIMTSIQKMPVQRAAWRYQTLDYDDWSVALTPNIFSTSPFDLCPDRWSGLTSTKLILSGHGIWLGSGFDLFLSGLAPGLLLKIAQNLSGLASGLHLHRPGSYDTPIILLFLGEMLFKNSEIWYSHKRAFIWYFHVVFVAKCCAQTCWS